MKLPMDARMQWPLDSFPPGDFNDPRFPFHLMHMEMALEEAGMAADRGEVPVGAVVVSLDHGVIARAHNQREMLNDPTAHAEILAFTQAAAALSSWRLSRCIMYVTLEPCPMCAGAAVQARLPALVYGCTDPKGGACHTLYNITNDSRLNHRVQVVGEVMSEACGSVLTEFFRKRRVRE